VIGRRQFITLLGGAATWPLGARAQRTAPPLIGFLSGSSRTERTSLVAAFRQGFAELGYVEERNVAIEYRWAEGQYARFPALISDLLRRQPAAIVAADAPSALAAKSAISTIPILFISGGDPLQSGLVSNLSRPSDNLTGVNLIPGPLPGKQLSLLHDLLPGAETIAHLINPNNANADRDAAIVQEAARTIGLKILVARAVVESDLETVFSSIIQGRSHAILVNSDVFLTTHRDRIVAMAAYHAIPAIYPWREFSAAGGLISYGPSLSSAYHQVGAYAGNILNGAKPADLPVIQPTTFELVVNSKTAKALNLIIPPGILAIADEVIE
jgi:putative ABC transport system substrate-binding protein